MFRKMVLFFTVLMISISIYSGEIKTGSVPGAVVYQGRVEKDNAPLNGLVHIIFKIYQYQTGGTPLWTSEEFLTEAKSGIFSITFQPPIDILSKGNQLYLEVVIEGEALSPREAIESVVYSLVAKKLEDGSSVHFSSITVGSSSSGRNEKAVIMGGIYTDKVCFKEDNSCVFGTNLGSVSNLTELYSLTNVNLKADVEARGVGSIIFYTSNTMRAVMTNNGNFGVGVETPSEKLVVGGNSMINNDLTVYGNLLLSGVLNNGVIKGLNNDQINIGSVNDRIDFVINGSTTVTVNGDRLGIGVITPSEALDVNGNIKTNSIMTGSLITISNEIKSSSGENLIIQNSNLANVGIGTDTPKAKLHVGGSIIADLGISASTATFTSDVEVQGDFSANSFGRKVSLSSTTIYGELNVIGQFSLNNDEIATRGSTQTFTGQNTFLHQLLISSNVFISGAIGIGADGLRYTDTPSYLQIGDSYVVSSTATLYMSAGANANSNINFYRGLNRIASLGTDGNNIQLKYGNSNTQRVYLDDSYFKLYKSTVVISPSASDTSPAIYVDGNSNVGIGTLSSSQERLNVAGKIKLNGLGSGIVFDDGTILTSNNSISVGSIYNPGTVFITANSDNSGSNDSMYFNMGNNTAIFIDNASKVGIGTVHPLVALDIMGGDVKIGNTAIYSPIRNGNLMVEGDVVVDGTFKQRSSVPVEFTSLSVSQNVYLSTSAGYNTGIGNQNPQHKLDVTGDINLTGDLRSNGNIILTSARGLENLSSISSAGTINFSDLQSNRLVATNGSNNLVSVITAANLKSSVTGTTGSAGNLVFSNAPTLTNITVTGWGNFSGGITASSGTFNQTGDYSIITSSGIKVGGTGTLQVGGLIENSLVATDASKNLTSSITSANLALSVNGITGSAGNLVFSTAPTLTDITITGWGNFSGGITASSGTFTNTGDYSIITSSGIYIDTGTINLNNSARIINVPNPQNNQDVATKAYVDQGGEDVSDRGAWLKQGNNIIGSNNLGSTNDKDVDFIRDGNTQFSMTSNGVAFSVPIISNYSITASSGTFNQTGNYSIITSSGIKVGGTGTLQVGGLTANSLVATDGSKNLTSGITAANLKDSVSGVTGSAGNLVFSTAPTLTNISVTGWGNFSSGITASSGTFTNTGDYSIKTSSGMNISAGTINLNNSAMIKNSPNPVDTQDVATKYYVDNLFGGGGTEPSAWIITGNNAGSGRVLGTTNPQSFNIISNNIPRITIGDTGIITLLSNTLHTIFVNGITASSGTFTKTGDYSIITSSGIKINSPGIIQIGGLAASRLVATDGSKNLTNSITSANLALSVTDETGSGSLVFNTNPSFTTGITVSGYGNFTGITASSGTFTNTGDYSIITSSGIQIKSQGTLQISKYTTAGFVKNDANGNLNGGNSISAGDITSGTLPISRGGTNKSLVAASGGVVWTDSDSMEVTNAGTVGQVLLSGGAASPTWGTLGLNYGGTGANLSGASDLPIKKSGSSLTAAAIDLSGSEVSSTLPASRGGTGISGAGGTANRVLLTTDGSTFSVGTISNNYLSVGSYINITGVGTLTAGTWKGSLIGLTYGGTNKNLVAASGGVVWTDSDSMEVTSAGTAGQVLLSGGATSPTWGTLGLNYGGTGANLSGASDLPIKKSGSSLTAAAIDLSGSEVSNTLPASRGGTGISGVGGTANRVLLTTDGSTWTAGQVNLNSVQTTGTLPVSRGGTGNTAFTDDRPIIYDSGGSKLISYNGFNGSFTVAKSTDSAQGCMQLNYQYGILASTATATCP